MRNPHADDLGRIEQTLRDLERGAFVAQLSYNRRTVPDPDIFNDAVTSGWVAEQRPRAAGILAHASNHHDVNIVIRTSRRPWVQAADTLGGRPGLLWHVDFFLRPPRTLNARKLWHDSSVQSIRDWLVHLVADHPGHVGFTFSAADDPVVVADSIECVIDAVLGQPDFRSRPGELDDNKWDRWERTARDADYRVLAGTGWNIVADNTLPYSTFCAGANVTSLPAW